MSNQTNDQIWDAVIDKALWDTMGPSIQQIMSMDLEQAYEYLTTGKYHETI